MKKACLALIYVFTLSCAVSCASRPTSRFGSEPNVESKAPGAAYAAEGFTFSKDMPIHQSSPFDFYYKSCSRDDGKVYYSKTSYDCTILPSAF